MWIIISDEQIDASDDEFAPSDVYSAYCEEYCGATESVQLFAGFYLF